MDKLVKGKHIFFCDMNREQREGRNVFHQGLWKVSEQTNRRPDPKEQDLDRQEWAQRGVY